MRRRTEMHRLVELVRLHRMGTAPREVARLLVMGPNTERQYRQALEAAGLLRGEVQDLPELEHLKAAVLAQCPPTLPPQQTSSVEEFRVAVEASLAKGRGPRGIFDHLKLTHPEFAGSYSAIKR
ncbi:MAG: IS21 family transposase, partial [Polyangiaceae bacterium]|nr:IS21 family transposase [Polyangiaceae bacterium]